MTCSTWSAFSTLFFIYSTLHSLNGFSDSLCPVVSPTLRDSTRPTVDMNQSLKFEMDDSEGFKDKNYTRIFTNNFYLHIILLRIGCHQTFNIFPFLWRECVCEYTHRTYCTKYVYNNAKTFANFSLSHLFFLISNRF